MKVIDKAFSLCSFWQKIEQLIFLIFLSMFPNLIIDFSPENQKLSNIPESSIFDQLQEPFNTIPIFDQ